MSILVSETPIDELYPPATSSFPDPPPPRWSRRRKVTTLAGAGLILALAGGGVWWNKAVTADPGLEFTGAASNVFRAVGDKTGITEIDNAVGDEAQVHYEPGGRFSAWMDLYNGGPRDVRIEEIGDGFYFFGVERVVGTDDPAVAFPEGDEPIGSFTLEAGETRVLRVDFRMADCDPAGLEGEGSFGISSMPVTYRVLGFSRTVAVPFRSAAITLDTWGGCDRPFPERD